MLIVITGPTASGKSEIAIKLAQRINGEIITADSMQVYKFLDIGTSKPTYDDRKKIKHHLIDILEPDKRFSAGEFVKYAKNAIIEISKRNNIPIIVGGTGLYIRSLLRGIFTNVETNQQIRNKLQKEAEKHGSVYLHQRLRRIDHIAASRIHPNDTRRLIRAIEVYEITGKPISTLQTQWQTETNNNNIIFIGISRTKKNLHKRIDDRVDKMINEGLVKETQDVLDKGYSPFSPGLQGIGYKEIVLYLKKKIGFEKAVEEIKKNTKNYAKKQLTWLKKEKDVKWVNLNFCSVEYVVKEIVNSIIYSE